MKFLSIARCSPGASSLSCTPSMPRLQAPRGHLQGSRADAGNGPTRVTWPLPAEWVRLVAGRCLRMSEAQVQQRISEVLSESGVSAEQVGDLASQLLWRIGRVSDEGPVTVRVGLASSATLFQDLPRLRTASDSEIAAAVEENAVRVEWVGPRPRGAA